MSVRSASHGLATCLLSALAILFTSPAILAGDIYRDRTPNLTVPNNQTWVYDSIVISGLPPDAYVAGIDVFFRGEHPYPEDLYVDLNDESLTRLQVLWNFSGDYPVEAQVHTNVFDGLPVNGVWKLYAKDYDPCCTGESPGKINEWWIRIYFNCQTCPYVSGFKLDNIFAATDADNDGYSEDFEFDAEVGVSVFAPQADVRALIRSPQSEQEFWTQSWTVGQAYPYWQPWPFSEGDFRGYLSDETALDFYVELWDPSKGIRYDDYPYSTDNGPIPVEPHFPYLRQHKASLENIAYYDDADGDWYYETFEFDVQIEADCDGGTRYVGATVECLETGDSRSIGPWQIVAAQNDFIYVPFTEQDFTNFQGNTDLHFKVSLWDDSPTNVIDETYTVDNQPIKADNSTLPTNVGWSRIG